jgi:hypothetical protein
MKLIIPEHCEQCDFYFDEFEGVCFLYAKYLLLDEKRTNKNKMYYEKCGICTRKEITQIELEYEK